MGRRQRLAVLELGRQRNRLFCDLDRFGIALRPERRAAPCEESFEPLRPFELLE
jgi:hypothetical protein